MITVGLIGAGAVVHGMYAKVLRGRTAYRVGFVTDVAPAQAASAAQLFGAQTVPVEDLVERSDAIIVTTPPDTHADVLRRCFRAGKTVLCEKPFATSHREASSIVADAYRAGTQLYVGHFRRAFPSLELARSLVSAGIVGNVHTITISEGGRFTWKSVSDYTVRSPFGGVLWDTGSHALDMALFAVGADAWNACAIDTVSVERDKPEPSHDFRGAFTLTNHGGARIACRLHVSRKDALPNLLHVTGDRGSVALVVGADYRVRLTTDTGSIVLSAERRSTDLLECFDVELQRILLKKDEGDFAAERFVSLTAVLEALAGA